MRKFVEPDVADTENGVVRFILDVASVIINIIFCPFTCIFPPKFVNELPFIK